MCREVLAHIGANDNFYGEGVGIEDIVLTIKNTFTEAVFDLHSDNKNVKTESLISEIKEKSEDSFKNTIKNKPIEVKSEIDSSSYAVNNIISGDKASNDRVPKTKLSDGPFSYTIFGKEYFSTGQADLMYNAFAALIEKYPNVAEKLTVRTSVARAEDVKNAGTKAAYPTYFRGCKVFKIGNLEYLVGTSYGFEEKLKEIKGMFRLCGADISQFVLNGESLSDNKKIKQVNSEEENLDLEEKIYKYTIFGKEYSSRGQANLMYDTFEALVARYPNLVERLTNRTCVSKAENVQNAGTKESNPVYFRGCRLFIVEGKEYLVGNSYSFDAKLAEIKGMLKLCGVREDEFQLISAPEKSKRNTTI